MLVVWADNVEEAEQRAQTYLDQVIDLFSQEFSGFSEKTSKHEIFIKEMPADSDEDIPAVEELEDDLNEPPRRPVLIQAALTGFTLFLIIAAIGSGWRQIAIEVSVDKSYIRLAFAIAVPFQIWLALVSCLPKL